MQRIAGIPFISIPYKLAPLTREDSRLLNAISKVSIHAWQIFHVLWWWICCSFLHLRLSARCKLSMELSCTIFATESTMRGWTMGFVEVSCCMTWFTTHDFGRVTSTARRCAEIASMTHLCTLMGRAWKHYRKVNVLIAWTKASRDLLDKCEPSIGAQMQLEDCRIRFENNHIRNDGWILSHLWRLLLDIICRPKAFVISGLLCCFVKHQGSQISTPPGSTPAA